MSETHILAPLDREEELPNTSIINAVQAKLGEIHDALAVLAGREYTREHNIAQQRAARQRARDNKAAPVPQTPEPLGLTG